MRYPAFLRENGTIGFVAPSFGCATEPYKSGFLNAQKRWNEQGFHLQLGQNCYVEEGVGISNTPRKCGEELTAYYCDKNNDCLISCGGGELMCEILDYVDFEQIRQAPPKWYLGYSDNTNFTFLLTTLCDAASVYGPCAAAFGMEPLHPSLNDAMLLLQGKKLTMQGYDKWERESLKDEEHPYVPYNLTEICRTAGRMWRACGARRRSMPGRMRQVSHRCWRTGNAERRCYRRVRSSRRVKMSNSASRVGFSAAAWTAWSIFWAPAMIK